MVDRTFLFLRHGETQFNKERRFQGSIDTPLNETGVEQARVAADRLVGFMPERIVSSPANRVLKTASFVVEQTGIPMHVDSDLMELNVGSHEGQNIDALKQAHGVSPDTSILDILPDDAERWETFVPKVVGSVRRWVARFPDELVLVVAHGLVFRALTQELVNQHLVTDNAVPHIFEKTPAGWDIRAL